MAPVFYGKLVFVTFFNAGVRAIDIRNPYRPREVGYFIPSITEATDKRCVKVDGQDRCKIAIQKTTSRPTTAATFTWSIAPTPACTFWR